MPNLLLRAALASFLVVLLLSVPSAYSCTNIMVGRLASADGSVMTSHTCDGTRYSTRIEVVPAVKYEAGAERFLAKRREDNTGAMPQYAWGPAGGKIPQPAETFGYLAPAYACMNDHQLAIGESTFVGRKELMSDKGLIYCETLTRLLLERAKTAREAIQIAGQLLEQYGWADLGEALTIADTKELWLMEIVGPGKDGVGAVWAAQRVPDDHVSVFANGSRIGEIDLAKPDFFMASANVMKFAEEKGYWNPKSGKPFRFYEAYNPESRTDFCVTRREWRVLDLLAPSLHLHPNSNVLPFSVKPEKPVGPEKIMELFRDTFEDTDFDMTKNLTVVDDAGKTVKSPFANPFMPFDMLKLFKINGGWGWRGERTIAKGFCTYATVTQSRASLPDPVGGVVWLGYSNPAMTAYVPLYAGIADLPDDYKTDARATGFSRRAAWWAFNRVAKLSAHRWSDMRNDVAAVRNPLQEKLLAGRKEIEAQACELLKQDPQKARDFLTQKTREACLEATQAYWNLGDLLWSKYDEKW
jgi:dipeptidase